MLASPTVLFDDTVTVPVNGDMVSPPIPEGAQNNALACWLRVSDATITSADIRIMHSPDGGTTWLELADFTQVTGNGNELVTVTTPFFGNLRVEVDGFSGSTARIQVIVQ